jgi:hypothetical protein
VAEVLPKIRVNQPFPHAPLTIRDAEKAFAHVLQHAGATLPRRDAVDKRIVHMVQTGEVTQTQISPASLEKAAAVRYAPEYLEELRAGVLQGYITDPAEVGGYPVYQGTPYRDSDNDGLPDTWEQQFQLDPHDPRDAHVDSNANGYANIEEFINGQDPRG